jgi:hypothetical protein
MANTFWSRLIPTRRRVVTYVVVIIGLLVVRLALDLWAGHRLRLVSDRLAPIYRGLDLASLAPPNVLPAENRARILSAAAALTVVQSSRGPAGGGALRQALFDFQASQFKDPSKRQEVLRASVETNRLALQLLDQAETRSKANWEITYRDGPRARMPSLMGIRDLSNVNVAAGLLDLADGHADEAARHARLTLVLAGSLAQEPSLIVQLVRISIATDGYRLLRDILAQADPPATALEALAGPLDEERRQRPVVVGLIGEMKLMNSLFPLFDQGGDPWSSASEAGAAGSVFAWFLRPGVKLVNARVLDQFDRLIEYARLQPYEREARKVSLPSDQPQPWWWRPFAMFSTAGLGRASWTGDQHRAMTSLAATAIALRRCRLERGTYPASLDALAPAYLSEVPIDPYTGRALEYRVAGAGFELRAKVPPKTDHPEFTWNVSR